MKIDTDNICEIHMYGVPVNDIVRLADLPEGIEKSYFYYPDQYFYVKDNDGYETRLHIGQDFVENRISLINSDIEMDGEERFKEKYVSFACVFCQETLTVATDSDTRAIPQNIADKLVLFSLYHDLKFEIKKADMCEQKQKHTNISKSVLTM